MLKLAGIDTDTFKLHSVRSASEALAGVTTNQIMDAADRRSNLWFYYKPTKIRQVVLSTSSTDSH